MQTARILVPLFLAVTSFAQSQRTMPNPYKPLTREERVEWFTKSSVGPVSALTVLMSAGIDTARDSPEEFGPHWGGFGKRIGYRFADRVVTNAMEISVGSIWGEDPRYFRVPERSTGARLAHAVKMTVVTHDRAGREMPAYARFIAVPSSAFLSNTWKPDSEDDTSDALSRVAVSFANRIAANAFAEFWPDLKRKAFRRKSSDPQDSVGKYVTELSR